MSVFRSCARRRRAQRAFVAVAAFACMSILVASVLAASRGDESWYDAEHGWRVTQKLWIVETNDGGATWRELPNPQDSQAGSVLRTGLRSGLYHNATDDRVYWTNDGGRFWGYSPRIGASLTGEGRFLFWTGGRSIYRVQPWPFPSRCVVVVRRDRCAYRDKRGFLREAKFTAVRVGTVPTGRVVAAVVPGGVVGATTSSVVGVKPYVILARWAGRATRPQVLLQELPHPPTGTLFACDEPFVDWPRLAISACDLESPRSTAIGVWRSDDGGRRWRLASG